MCTSSERNSLVKRGEHELKLRNMRSAGTPTGGVSQPLSRSRSGPACACGLSGEPFAPACSVSDSASESSSSWW